MDQSVDQQHPRWIVARLAIALDELRKRTARVGAEQVLVLEAGVERAGGNTPGAARTVRDASRRLADPRHVKLGLALGACKTSVADHEDIQTAGIQTSPDLADQFLVLELQRVAAVQLDDPGQRHFGCKAQSLRVGAHSAVDYALGPGEAVGSTQSGSTPTPIRLSSASPFLYSFRWMKAAPADLDFALLEQSLLEHWGIRPSRLEYLPVGFGDHHWDATAGGIRYFVTVRDLRLDARAADPHQAVLALERTFQAVRRLKEIAGLQFIVPAVLSSSGATVVPIGSRFVLSVYDWMNVWPVQDAMGAASASLVAQLHRASREHAVDGVSEDFKIPHRYHLEAALGQLQVPWLDGPFGEPSRHLLAAHRAEVRSALQLYDHLVDVAHRVNAEWCLTHGEPDGGNLVQDQAGAPHLVDWESARVAPAERDLARLDLSAEALAGYVDIAGGPPPQADILRLYRLWYDLAESAVYLMQFRAPHAADDNMIESWQNFQTFLPTAARWPEVG
jgi:spectinomycin phosphotransferase